MSDPYGNQIARMWQTMATLHPAEFMRFTGNAANEIATVVEKFDISTTSDFDTLALLLPNVFASAMAGAKDRKASKQQLPPEPFVTFLREAASACQRIAAPDSDGSKFAFRIGPHAANAVLEGVDDVDYIRWSIYRSFIELLLDQDPLLPEIESSAIAFFQSGLRTSGWG